MKKFNKEKFRSPSAVFVWYMIAAFIVIMGFRFIFPGETAPIPYFSRNWRLVRGLLDILTLFPALAMSGLVIPFGMTAETEEGYTSFSPKFFQRLTAPVVTAICSAAVYGLIFFLVLPLFRDIEGNMRFKGELYRLAKEQAQTHSRAGDWLEASQFIGICDRVWPDSPELTAIKTEAALRLEAYHFEEESERAAARAELAGGYRSASVSGLPGDRQPVDAADAIAMGEAALADERYYDAHWLATLGERLARNGSPEAATAVRLAGRVWNKLESLEPNAREAHLYSLYNLKRSGYTAMISGDWIRAFYIFQELAELTPDDPDTAKFLAASERGTLEVAFFIDEMELSLGGILTGAMFSLPSGARGRGSPSAVPPQTPGRTVLRFSSLSTSPDYAYGIGLDYLSFDAQARPIARLESSYAKILPVTLDGRPQVLILMRALDRHDKDRRWEPEWTSEDGSAFARRGDTQITLDISYENFILLSEIRRGLANLQIGELFSASKLLGSAGYISQVFEAEILNRIGAALFFLPMTILAIIIGWRYRAKKRPRYLFVPMFPVLPLVFNVLVHLYRTVLNTLGVSLIMLLGFSTALIIFIASLALLFFLSLIVLAAQHG